MGQSKWHHEFIYWKKQESVACKTHFCFCSFAASLYFCGCFRACCREEEGEGEEDDDDDDERGGGGVESGGRSARKRSRRIKRKIGQEGGAFGEKGIRNLHSSQAWRERMMVRLLKIGPCEREEQSVSKYVRRTGRACVCVWGSRGERSSTVAEKTQQVFWR